MTMAEGCGSRRVSGFTPVGPGKDHNLQRSALNLTPDMIDFAMREVVVPSSRHKNIIGAKADEILYKNAVKSLS